MRSNTLVVLLIFIGIAYFLYYKDKRNGPLSKFTDRVVGVFSTRPTDENPYKAPENPSPTEESSSSSTSGNIGDRVLGKVKDVLATATGSILTTESNVSSQIERKWYPLSKKKLEVVEHLAFTLGYSEPHEQAAWVVHRLTKEDTQGNAKRNGMEFRPDNKVSTQSALSSDYTRSGYDRGHLVPAGDFRCCFDKMANTFVMSNISPQDQNFNRYIWNDVEHKVRGWARGHEEIMVYTGPIISSSPAYIGRYNQVAVPSAFYKIVFFQSKANPSKIKMMAFLVPNAHQPNRKPQDFVVSVDEVEKRTGLDFFSFLPDNREAELEQSAEAEGFQF